MENGSVEVKEKHGAHAPFSLFTKQCVLVLVLWCVNNCFYLFHWFQILPRNQQQLRTSWYKILIIGVSARFFCLISKTSPRIAKANFHQSLVQGKLIRIWWIGFHPLCGVRRSPDWLISRPLRWLSCLHYSHSLLSTIRFAGSLDAPESRQIKAFYHRFVTENLGILYPLDRLPGGN